LIRRVGAALVAATAVMLSVPGSAHGATRSTVYQIDQTGTVDPLSARMVERGLAQARDASASAVVVRIDTPGGLDSSMRRMIQAIQASPIPVICWVGPPGARAASAGAFILIGCPVAAMAPGTNVGAAHPVGLSGSVLAEKITNDAAAYIRSLAERWGRNADWGEKAVRDSVSISANEALRIKVIDLIAADRAALLNAVNGRIVRTGAGDVTLSISDPTFVRVRATIAESLLHGLFDPDLAFLFFVFGIAGVVFEVLHPGVNVPGVVGIILLLSSFVIFGLLPVNIAGLILIMAAIAFFVIDLKVPGHGVPTAAGITSLVLGGLYLFNGSVPNARVSRPLIVGVAVALAGLFFFVVRAAVRARHAPPAKQRIEPGMTGVVERELAPTGIVRIGKESWTGRTRGASIPAGTPVRVIGMTGLTVEVEPGGEAGQTARPTETEVS
jgi:membrane-bound serine protease (ClpP class)